MQCIGGGAPRNILSVRVIWSDNVYKNPHHKSSRFEVEQFTKILILGYSDHSNTGCAPWYFCNLKAKSHFHKF